MHDSEPDEAFLQPILANYADDAPRLIWADALEETINPSRQARGELIRLQCCLARMAEDDHRRDALVARESELLDTYRLEWGFPLQGLVSDWEWRRGLLDSVSMDAHQFLTHGDELFRRAPIRRVRLLDAARHMARLIHCPFLGLVRELDLCGSELGNGGLNLLVRSRYLQTLELLNLSFNSVCDGGVQLLARAGTLPRLRTLLLHDNGYISSEGVHALANTPTLDSLRVLDLSGNDISDAGIRYLVESQYLQKLHTLRITANHIGDAGVQTLMGSALLTRLLQRDPRLNLRQNVIGMPGVLALAKASCPATTLDLSGNYLGDEGVRALVEQPAWPTLRRLYLAQNSISDLGAMALARSGWMQQLQVLDLSSNRLTHQGIDALWKARGNWRTRLELANNLAAVNSEPRPRRSRW